jgi:hypothetical protein
MPRLEVLTLTTIAFFISATPTPTGYGSKNKAA